MSATWKAKHPDAHRAYQKARAERLRAELITRLNNLKRARGCDFCGYGMVCALSYVHRPDEEIRFKVNGAAWSYTTEAVDAEIDKCYVMCQNCIACHDIN